MKFYKRDGSPLNHSKWSALIGLASYRQVARTTLRNGGMVSTIWTGADYSGGNGPPIIFETAVFGPQREPIELMRYSTEAKARIGHAEAVAIYNTPAEGAIVWEEEER